MQYKAQPTGTVGGDVAWGIIAAFLSTVDLLAAIVTRHSFGKQYLGVGRLFTVALIGLPTIGLYHEANQTGMGTDYLFLFAVLSLGFFHRTRASTEHRKGNIQHSGYTGFPIALTIAGNLGWISEKTYRDDKRYEYLEFGFKSFGDPIIAFVILSLITQVWLNSGILSLWATLSCLALFAHSLKNWGAYRKTIRDRTDAMFMQGQTQRTQDVQVATELMNQVVAETMPQQQRGPVGQKPERMAFSRPAPIIQQPKLPPAEATPLPFKTGLDAGLMALLDDGEEKKEDKQPVAAEAAIPKPPPKRKPLEHVDPALRALMDSDDAMQQPQNSVAKRNTEQLATPVPVARKTPEKLAQEPKIEAKEGVELQQQATFQPATEEQPATPSASSNIDPALLALMDQPEKAKPKPVLQPPPPKKKERKPLEHVDPALRRLLED